MIGEYVLERNLCRKKDERVVVVSDRKKLGLARQFLPADGEMVVFEGTSRHGEEPPEFVAEAMASSDIFMLITDKSLSHTKARIEACRNGARGFSSPGLEEYMIEAMKANPEKLRERNERLMELLNADEIEIETNVGMLRVPIAGREWISDDGLLCSPGSFGNLPAGEIFIAPLEHQADGRFEAVFNGKRGLFEVREGRMVKGIKELDEILEGDGRLVAELGIGTNHLAKLSGNILMDEKVLGTAHIAFGTNTSFGGKIEAGVHIDVVIENPTIKADGKVVMDKGKLML